MVDSIWMALPDPVFGLGDPDLRCYHYYGKKVGRKRPKLSWTDFPTVRGMMEHNTLERSDIGLVEPCVDAMSGKTVGCELAVLVSKGILTSMVESFMKKRWWIYVSSIHI